MTDHTPGSSPTPIATKVDVTDTRGGAFAHLGILQRRVHGLNSVARLRVTHGRMGATT